jgi:nucleotide-binding universal stress UspA family protein
MFPTKILVAVDGSAEAERAARMAKAVSERLDSELHVAHATPLLPASTAFSLETGSRRRSYSR